MSNTEELAAAAVIEGMDNAIKALKLTAEFEGENPVSILAWGSDNVAQEDLIRTLAYEVARAALAAK